MNLCEYCKGCKHSRVAQEDHPSYSDSTPEQRAELNIYKKGEFAVECSGIPTNYEDLLDESFLQTHTQAQIDRAVESLDPVAWAVRNLHWKGRVSPHGLDYQSIILRCSAKRKVLRMGRRSGKTNGIAVDAIWHVFTNSKFKVLIITPFQSQIELIIKEINKLLDQNLALRNSVIRNVKTPFYLLELTNGSTISAFTSGAQSASGATGIRGQGANRLIIDEGDYLNPEDINTITVILGNTHPIYGEPTYLISSTPSGAREYYYGICLDPTYKEFHFPSSISPDWSPAVELELKRQYTDAEYQHEILAEFGELEAGVFQNVFVEASLRDYSYAQMRTVGPQPGWIYCMGVDWNSVKNGTRLYVIGWDTINNIYRIVDKQVVSQLGWNLHAAVEEVVKLNRKWRPEWIYVDDGYGHMPVETLHAVGSSASMGTPDANLLKNVKPIALGSSVELYDPWIRERIEKPIKPFFVQNAVRKFERGLMEIPFEDESLRRQLLGYHIKRLSPNGNPVYAPITDSIGDHDLDAMMFALYAFTKEFSEFSSPIFTSAIASVGRLGETRQESSPLAQLKRDTVDDPSLNSMGHPLPQSRTKEFDTGFSKLPGANLNQSSMGRKIWPSANDPYVNLNPNPQRQQGRGRLFPRRSFF